MDWMDALTFSSAFVFCFSCFYSLLDCSRCPSCSLSFLDFLSPRSLTLVSFSFTLFVCLNGCTCVCVCSRLRPTPFDSPSLSSAWYGSGMDMDNYSGDDWGVDTIARQSLAQQRKKTNRQGQTGICITMREIHSGFRSFESRVNLCLTAYCADSVLLGPLLPVVR